ncbi:MAG: hypothetical protein H6876_10005 [Hyphomicrobiaceae bacterium]|nr:hypothetical protein [Hyphomicrobiaceae bacterium]MCC0008439.1 hypothetical protein [Hyphomicrobiaceae bacterium]
MPHRPHARLALLTAALLAAAATTTAADKVEHAPEAQAFVHGTPSKPSEAWTLAAGGRLYDNWWVALDRAEPTSTHPSYPASGKAKGAATWRCKECHGWDYKGRDGRYRTGSHTTGIIGVMGARGRDEADLVRLLRAPVHGYTSDMMRDDELLRVAAFINRGLHDMSDVIGADDVPLGNVERGKSIFQTICAACHGFDGRLINWGTVEEPSYVGTEASRLPDEVLHKLRNSHPGAAMVNLRALPLSDAVDVLTYAATLPTR